MKKSRVKGLALVYLISTVFFFSITATLQEPVREEKESRTEQKLTATELGVMCISSVYPSMGIQLADSRDNDSQESQSEAVVLESEETTEQEQPDVTGKEPRVLILHTHATESYLPSEEGNFHVKEEANTVRDVGNTLVETLNKRGIAVVHDKTLHDYPSYNESYYRSYATAQNLLKQYPTIECVIDLHRDSVASKEPSATVSIGGMKCAKYSFVLGTTASTYPQNKEFISKLNQIAASNYQGFTGTVLERGYKYNQDLSSKYLLLEIGFNRNHIDDSKNTAVVVGNILADALQS